MSRLDALLAAMQARDDAPCLHDDGMEFTYATLASRIHQTRIWLRSQSASGGTLGLRGDFGIVSIALFFAALAEGKVVALLPSGGNAEELLAEACVGQVVSVADATGLSMERLPDPPAHALLEQLRQSGDSGVVIFTSGSAGRPKAALHATERLLAKFDRAGRRMRTLAFLRFDHIAGLDTMLHTFAAGGTLVTLKRRDPMSVLKAMQAGRVEVLSTSPSFLRMLCATPSLEQWPLEDLKIITYGSEPMDAATLRKVNECFPGRRIEQKYGTTETGSPRTQSRDKDSLWLRFKDTDAQGRPLFEVRDGVLWLRGAGTLLGYLNAPTPVDADGWYCTGDLVECDGEWIRFRGRRSEIINVGGEKVAPAEVEATLLELPFVASAVVSGEAHPLLGQIVVARVALFDVGVPDDCTAAIRRHCRARLASYKVPVKIRFVDGTGLTDRQKASRRSAQA